MATDAAGAIGIAPAGSADRADVVDLLLATRRHYWGVKPGDEADAAAMAAAVLDGGSDVHMVIARTGETALGYATFAILHPAPSAAGTLFLKDLFVVASARGAGVGRVLLRWLAREAASLGCVRFDWTAETDNPKALAFYDALGAMRVTDKVYYRFTGEALARFAGGEPQAVNRSSPRK